MFKNSDEVIACIEERTKNRNYGLANFEAYMNTCGNPQLKLKCIHVAGTNGKGSTTNYLRSMLQSAGYKVGTFTSPYLETHLDRIRINDSFIEDQAIVDYANNHYDTWMEHDLSMFEIDMYMAVRYFLENNVDIAIFEVGLGGRLDATNIIKPMISVITNIGLDHMQYLGNTYESIAKEKGGIIKTATPLVTGEIKQSCLDVFEGICKTTGSELIRVKQPTNIKYHQSNSTLSFDYQQYNDLTISSLAKYQCYNASCALATILKLQELQLIKITEDKIRLGLLQGVWKGRFEVVSTNPLIIIDGAHNNQGISALVESLPIFKDVHIIFSALKDKSTDDMMELLLQACSDITVTEFEFYRAQTATLLAKDFPVKIEPNWKKAIEEAYNLDRTTIITGSLYFISQVREYIKQR
ncbi:MAG: folylpolyglutamate synthase/dihydrofolate synthase family protein [Erysipelotrichaceae bacterium]